MPFIDDYKEYCAEFTDSPPIFHHRIAYCILSTVLSRKVFLLQGYKKVFPNLWLIIVAPSSFYRKSYSLGIAEDILRSTSELTGESYILPREFSHEKFVEILAQQPQGLLIAYEFRTFMAMMSKDYMIGTQSMITELFDNPAVYDRKTKTGEYEIKDPFLNILTATTIDWLKASIKDIDLASGFLPRFLIAPHIGKKDSTMAWQKPHDLGKKDALVAQLTSISKLSGPCTITEEAKTYYSNWYKRFEDEWSRPGLLSPFYARIQEYAKKLAILTCIDQTGACLIGVDHMKTACTLSDTYTRWITSIVEEDLTYMDKGQRKVMEAIKEAGDNGISREELLRKTRLLADRQLAPIIATFLESKQVKQVTESFENKQGAARTKTVYFWKNGDYSDDD